MNGRGLKYNAAQILEIIKIIGKVIKEKIIFSFFSVFGRCRKYAILKIIIMKIRYCAVKIAKNVIDYT